MSKLRHSPELEDPLQSYVRQDRSLLSCHRGMLVFLLAFVAGLNGCGFFVPVTSGTTTSGSSTTTGSTAYVANSGAKTVTGYTISSTGALSALSSASFTLPISPLTMAITPSNSFLYVGGVGGIYGFQVSSTGTLTALNSGNALIGESPFSLDVSPDGKWLFDLEADGATLNYYSINSSTGGISVASSVTYGVPNAVVLPHTVRVAPSGNFVAVALGTAGDLIFTFNTSTGALASASSIASGATTISDNVAIFDSTSAFIYVARSGTSSGVAAYSLSSLGIPTAVASAPVTAGNLPYALQLSSTGAYLYCANRNDGTISAYTVSNGALTQVSGSPYTSGSLVSSLRLDSTGAYLLAASYGGGPDLGLYTIATTGTSGGLSLTSSTTTGTDPVDAISVVTTH
jgi:6-phosphogluconolactonase